MKLACLSSIVVLLLVTSCSKKEGHHPWVEPGMSRTEVVDIMGTPIRTDSIYHQYVLDRGSMSWELLDSVRRTLPAEESNRMTLGHVVDHSVRSDRYVSWYYGPEVLDTSFTFERAGTKSDSLVRVWFQVRKQRAVVFDTGTMVVRERGFSVLDVRPL